MAFTSRIAWENLRTFDSATLTGAIQAFSTPLANPSYILKMVNRSSVDVLVYVDGINAIDVCPANSFWLYDEGKVGLNSGFPALPAGTQISISGAASTGNIYLVTQYIIQA